MPEPIWPHFPLVAAEPQGRSWLTLVGNLGRSPATLEAYGRSLDQYLRFCRESDADAQTATLEHVSLFVRHLNGEACGSATARTRVSNATLQQRLTALRLWYDHLVYQGMRNDNPIPRGRPSSDIARMPGLGRPARGLVPRETKLPDIPSDADWALVLDRAAREGLRNRLMFALAYFGALRREELVSLKLTDFDFAHRLIRIRPETTKGGRARVVCYSAVVMPSLSAYLAHRRVLAPGLGPLFLSESDRNARQPLSKWSWSKCVAQLARDAGVIGFSTHTLRHLRLTHLARAGWKLPEIAAYAGHRSTQTTMQYIHLSGSDLLERMARSMDRLDAALGATLLPASLP